MLGWDGTVPGLSAGEDEDTLYVLPEGIGSDRNMTIATLRTQPAGTANVTFAVLGQVPGFVAPYTFMPTMHLDTTRGQMIAALQGRNGPPPNATSPGSPLRDDGDLFLVIADIFPSNGTVARVLLNLTKQDTTWGPTADVFANSVSAFEPNADGGLFWLNPDGKQVPSTAALYGFPLNGSAATVVPYGASPANVDYLFFSSAQNGLLVVLDDGASQPSLARFSPPSPEFKTLYTWKLTDGEENLGQYDVSPDGTKFLLVLFDSNFNPVVSIIDLQSMVEVKRVRLRDFDPNNNYLVDVNFCNVNNVTR
jgi:hypothetical protein